MEYKSHTDSEQGFAKEALKIFAKTAATTAGVVVGIAVPVMVLSLFGKRTAPVSAAPAVES